MRTIFFTILAFFLTPIAIADTEDANDIWQTAEPLQQDTSVTGTQSDDDWYVINAATSNRILIDLTFTHADGNIDLWVFNDEGGLGGDPTATLPGGFRANSPSLSDDEFVDTTIPLDGTYYIRVSGGTGGNQGNSYTLTWTQLPGSDDGFEENDSNVAAAAITESIVNFGSQSDGDWYSIDAAADNTRLLVSLRFNFANDFDLELRDVGGTLLASSTNGVGVNESIDYTAPTKGTYHLNVSCNDCGKGYAIDWEGIAPTATTTTTTATPTGGSSGSISLAGLFALMLVGVVRRLRR
jgi:hypothetical protein